MSGNGSQDDFRARLNRIGGKSGQTTTSIPEANHQVQVEKRLKPEAVTGMGLVRKIQIYGFIGIFALLGGAFAANKYGGDVKASITNLMDGTKLLAKATTIAVSNGGTMNSIGGQKNTTSGNPVEDTGQGIIYNSPAILAGPDANGNIGHLVDGYSPESVNQTPPEFSTISQINPCTAQRPKGNEKVVGVRLDSGIVNAPVQVFDRSHMVTAMLPSLNNSTKYARSIRLGQKSDWKSEYSQMGQVKNQLSVVDVFITDTSAPLYLVLQQKVNGVLWNLQLAPGVELAHVVTVSRMTAAVAGLPEGVGLEAVVFGKPRDIPADCQAKIMRNPKPDWPDVIRAESGDYGIATQMDFFREEFDKYNIWYKGVFGLDADKNTLTAISAAHVLIGPFPNEKMNRVDLGKRTAMITPSEYIITGNDNSRTEQVEQLHSDLIHAAMGGDFDLLWPPVMKGQNQ